MVCGVALGGYVRAFQHLNVDTVTHTAGGVCWKLSDVKCIEI